MFETKHPIATEQSTVEDDKSIKNAVKACIDSRLADKTSPAHGRLYIDMLKLIEQPLLDHTMTHTRGNQVQASKLLGLSRGTLRQKLKTHGML